MLKKRTLYLLAGSVGLLGLGGGVSFALLRPRPARLAMTARAGDDTLVVNQVRTTRLEAVVLDQYGRRLESDSAVRYRWIGGDSIRLSPIGDVHCDRTSDAVVRATLGRLARQFVLRCRPVASIQGPSWVDLVAGDSGRSLSFVAHGPDGRVVTELRGAVTVPDGSIASIVGTTVHPKQSGQTFAMVEVGNAKTLLPIVVYQPVKSFLENPQTGARMAMHVSLARGDTMEVPVPKAAFWVTYWSTDQSVIPPTIEIVGDGSCTTGNGLRQRRVEEGVYAKYCRTGSGAHMMIAHGAMGEARVNGVVAVRLEW